MRAYTSLAPENIVIVSPGFLVSSQERSSADTPLGRVVDLDVREEALTPRFASTMRARSARLDVSIRCQDRRLKTNALTFYSGADLTGHAEQTHPPSLWVSPPAEAFAGELMSAVCDPDYHRPDFARANESQGFRPKVAASAVGLGPTVSLEAPSARPQPESALSAPAYGIDLGAYSELDRANHVIDKVQAIGLTQVPLKYYITVLHKDGALIYAVKLKTFTERDKADHLCKRIHDVKLDCQVEVYKSDR